MFKATKKLGQHFLRDQRVLAKITGALDIKPDDVVVEIGPGHGELTKYLLETGAKVIAIEKDSSLVKQLASIKYKRLEIIEGDALKMLLILNTKYLIPNTPWKLIGNIPYYITGFLFRLLADIEPKPAKIVFTIQKEVAERICAKPPQMNLLAASVQYWAKSKIVGIVKKTAFRPQPKVDSAIITLEPSQRPIANSERYYKFIKILFKQPRKTIWNNLKQEAGIMNNEENLKQILSENKIDPNARPQNLNVEQIKNLSEELSNTL